MILYSTLKRISQSKGITMLLLGLDLETTGLDVKECEIIELGAVLWDTGRKKPIAIYNDLVLPVGGISQEIVNITGITQEDLNEYGIELGSALRRFNDLNDLCDYVVAHNGTNFDKPILELAIASEDITDYIPKHWIDTSIDVDYPTKTRKLGHLASEHGFVNPFAHRAFADVLTMLTVLSHYDINQVVDNSRQSLYEVQAVCLPPWKDPAPEGTKETDLAKARGYRWNAGEKKWTKNIRQTDLKAEESHGEFGILVLGEVERG